MFEKSFFPFWHPVILQTQTNQTGSDNRPIRFYLIFHKANQHLQDREWGLFDVLFHELFVEFGPQGVVNECTLLLVVLAFRTILEHDIIVPSTQEKNELYLYFSVSLSKKALRFKYESYNPIHYINDIHVLLQRKQGLHDYMKWK